MDSVRVVLQPYMDRARWKKVRDTILAEESEPAPALDRFLSTEEICELLHVSRVTIFRYVRAGKLKPHKLGRRNLYSLNEVLATLKNEEVPND